MIKHFNITWKSLFLHPNLVFSSLRDILHSLEGLVLLSVHVEPVHFKAAHGHLVDGELDVDICVCVLGPRPGHEVDAAPDVGQLARVYLCLLYTSPSPRDGLLSRMPSSA